MGEEQKLKTFKEKIKFFVGCSEENNEKSAYLSVDAIMPNPYQPRRKFETTSLEELADSIREVGVISPITVRRAPGGFELVCGERRLRAAKMAGLKKIPAIIVELTDKDSAVLAITENLQRKDLSFFEAAESMHNLIEFHSFTQEAVAKKLGKSQAAVANKLRLLKLTEPVRRIINEAGLTERHARAFLRLPTEDMRIAAAKRAVESEMNVASTERMVQKMLEEEPAKRMTKKENGSAEYRGRLFKNTINKTVDLLVKSGVKPIVSEQENEKYIEYTITLPKRDVSRETSAVQEFSENVSRETFSEMLKKEFV